MAARKAVFEQFLVLIISEWGLKWTSVDPVNNRPIFAK